MSTMEQFPHIGPVTTKGNIASNSTSMESFTCPSVRWKSKIKTNVELEELIYDNLECQDLRTIKSKTFRYYYPDDLHDIP